MGDCRDGARNCRCVHMLKGSEAEISEKRGGMAESNRERSLTSRGWLGDRMGRIWPWIENLGTATRCMVWQRMSVNSVGERVVPCETPARFPYPHPPHVPCLANPPHCTYVTFFSFSVIRLKDLQKPFFYATGGLIKCRLDVQNVLHFA